MNQIPEDYKGAFIGFVVLLSKGMLDDDRWDWDIDNTNWPLYLSAFNDPGILRATLSVFLNNLKCDADHRIENYDDARYRAFQYFRAMLSPDYVAIPKFEEWELVEPDWIEWES